MNDNEELKNNIQEVQTEPTVGAVPESTDAPKVGTKTAAPKVDTETSESAEKSEYDAMLDRQVKFNLFSEKIRKGTMEVTDKTYGRKKNKKRFEFKPDITNDKIEFVSTKTRNSLIVTASRDDGYKGINIAADSKYTDLKDNDKKRKKKNLEPLIGTFANDDKAIDRISEALEEFWKEELDMIRFNRRMRIITAALVILFILYLIFSRVQIRLQKSQISVNDDGIVEYSLTAKNNLGPGYLRVKVNATTTNKVSDEYIRDHLQLGDGSVLHNDGWYYYEKVAMPGQSYPVVKGTTIDTDETGDIQISVDGQVIQWAFSRVNFDSDNPWASMSNKLNLGSEYSMDDITAERDKISDDLHSEVEAEQQ